MDRSRALFTPSFFAARAGAGSPDPAPIFIVGLPRAGSTLIEQILASHSLVEATLELPVLGNIIRDLSLSRRLVTPDTYPECMSDLTGPQLAELGARYIDGVFFNVFAVFSISYIVNTLHLSRTTALWAVCSSAFVMIFFIPLFGRLSDHWGRGRTYAISCILLAISTYPAFLAMSSGNVVAIFASIIIPFGIVYAMCYGPEVLRSIRSTRALHRHLLRLSILGDFLERDHADRRHLSDCRQRQPAMVLVRLCRVRGAGERGLFGRDQGHGVAAGGHDSAPRRGLSGVDSRVKAALAGRLCIWSGRG